ncbi:hypothetical protein BOTCAL_0018g00060 [Botryotinia calthae]|uniref:Uncharacterized protein n=1 Tax=Botryotinia calthae TaxID=38488 RepID=A0A4Y8DF65_9HELO|nr:hypothetical protein BOTCAL_0018g00060 [Botryotinia calthae]
MTVSINQADLHSVQGFFWDLTERIGIKRFDFSPANSENEKKLTIQAHCRITERLLKLLNEEPNNETVSLVGYELEFLPHHIGEVKKALLLDKGKVEGLAFQVIAKILVDLLSDAEAIEKFCDISGKMPYSWWRNVSLNNIRDFLRDERTIAQLEPKERRWVNVNTILEEKADFYRPITLMVAKKWLQDTSRTWNAYNSYEWVNKLVDIEELYDDDINDTKIDSPRLDSTYSARMRKRILSRATWARKALNLDEESLWYERISQTFYEANESKMAIEYFNKAKSFAFYYWTVNEYLALAYSQSRSLDDDSWRECASYELESAITALKSMQMENKSSEDERSDSLARILDLNQALFRNLAQLTLW